MQKNQILYFFYAEKKYKQYINDSNAKLFDYKMAKISQKFTDILAGLKDFGSWIKTAGWVAIIGAPFWDYYNEIEKGMEAVKSGEWDNETFEKYRKQRTAILITKVSKQIFYYLTIGGVSKVASSVGTVAGNIITFGKLSKIPGIGVISSLSKLTTTSAQMYFMSSISTKEGADAIAQLVVSPIFGSKFTISDILGTAATSSIDYLQKKAEEAVVAAGSVSGTNPNAMVDTSTPAATSAPTPPPAAATSAPEDNNISYAASWEL